MGRIAGLGEGTFVLIVIWSVVGLVSFLARGAARPKLITVAAIGIAAVVTAALVVVPRSDEGSQPIDLDTARVDVNAIPRWLTVASLAIFVIAAGVLGVAVEWTTPVRAINDPSRW
eukprot:TRINITY_DN2823_c0_g1_i1.p2 TRINITY_DN2823_c0_g1~~TRINITY_DN2823_c0_g1_i1.p2  ORF type:complete len:116 (+),score=8.64 TRINITY_DN2823_c0_g1_i1:33-380(+)